MTISHRQAVLRVVSPRSSPEQIEAAVRRHDQVSDPDRVKEHHEYARGASPGHHRELDHANLRKLRDHPDIRAALEEIAQQQAAQTQQDAATYAWRRSAAMQTAAANLARWPAEQTKAAAWRGLGTWYGLYKGYGVGTVTQGDVLGTMGPVQS